MVIGVPKEIKTHEYRVAMTPPGVKTLVKDGHRVLCEPSLGEGSGFADQECDDGGGGGEFIDETDPSVPAGLSATAYSSTQIDLSWIASTDNTAVTRLTSTCCIVSVSRAKFLLIC